MVILLLLVYLAATAVVSAQDATTPSDSHGQGLGTGLCLLIGAGISAAVAFLKGKFVFVQNNPKIIATVISIIVAIAEPLIVGHSGAAWSSMALCAVTQLAAAVATHETIIKPASQDS
jgi:hypothetical protein